MSIKSINTLFVPPRSVMRKQAFARLSLRRPIKKAAPACLGRQYGGGFAVNGAVSVTDFGYGEVTTILAISLLVTSEPNVMVT